MPLIPRSTYPGPPFYQFNGHAQTIFPAILRKVSISYERERLELPDGDFVDLDWIVGKSRKLAILSHGLEGNTDRVYMKGMAKYFHDRGWDVLAWNCRSCSGEMNRKLRMYNHGEIEDIGDVITHALKVKNYEEVALIGFSMGGAITLKYLGVHGKNIPEPIRCGIAFSSPCDLKASVDILEHPSNRFYKKRFLKTLKVKMKTKAEQFPGAINFDNYELIQEWRDFDNFFSAPISGFKDADDLYENASAKNFMPGIAIPCLLVNAQNDPILNEDCTPVSLCEKHAHIYLEHTKAGGHVGFDLGGRPHTWAEVRAFQFATSL